ncbi:hypothetical protein L596_005264 [Steinernema carpocapsae]|uniref:Uncharacterized protein n=1 Tax=Steinernema carpocapsae TaxID=34508 RepID=A0A4U8V012_STECR|nr:hypothetical protein L596_005264 [Steinernema carpocapsae]
MNLHYRFGCSRARLRYCLPSPLMVTCVRESAEEADECVRCLCRRRCQSATNHANIQLLPSKGAFGWEKRHDGKEVAGKVHLLMFPRRRLMQKIQFESYAKGEEVGLKRRKAATRSVACKPPVQRALSVKEGDLLLWLMGMSFCLCILGSDVIHCQPVARSTQSFITTWVCPLLSGLQIIHDLA